MLTDLIRTEIRDEKCTRKQPDEQQHTENHQEHSNNTADYFSDCAESIFRHIASPMIAGAVPVIIVPFSPLGLCLLAEFSHAFTKFFELFFDAPADIVYINRFSV